MKQIKLLDRLIQALLVLGGAAFVCGGVARTVYQNEGPEWLNSFADLMWGTFVCCISIYGAYISLKRLSSHSCEGWSRFNNFSKLVLSSIGVIVGLVIIVIRVTNLLGVIW